MFLPTRRRPTSATIGVMRRVPKQARVGVFPLHLDPPTVYHQQLFRMLVAPQEYLRTGQLTTLDSALWSVGLDDIALARGLAALSASGEIGAHDDSSDESMESRSPTHVGASGVRPASVAVLGELLRQLRRHNIPMDDPRLAPLDAAKVAGLCALHPRGSTNTFNAASTTLSPYGDEWCATRPHSSQPSDEGVSAALAGVPGAAPHPSHPRDRIMGTSPQRTVPPGSSARHLPLHTSRRIAEMTRLAIANSRFAPFEHLIVIPNTKFVAPMQQARHLAAMASLCCRDLHPNIHVELHALEHPDQTRFIMETLAAHFPRSSVVHWLPNVHEMQSWHGFSEVSKSPVLLLRPHGFHFSSPKRPVSAATAGAGGAGGGAAESKGDAVKGNPNDLSNDNLLAEEGASSSINGSSAHSATASYGMFPEDAEEQVHRPRFTHRGDSNNNHHHDALPPPEDPINGASNGPEELFPGMSADEATGAAANFRMLKAWSALKGGIGGTGAAAMLGSAGGKGGAGTGEAAQMDAAQQAAAPTASALEADNRRILSHLRSRLHVKTMEVIEVDRQSGVSVRQMLWDRGTRHEELGIIPPVVLRYMDSHGLYRDFRKGFAHSEQSYMNIGHQAARGAGSTRSASSTTFQASVALASLIPRLEIHYDHGNLLAREQYQKLKAYEVMDGQDPDLIVPIGGDGYMMHCIRQNWSRFVPFFGVNAGHRGYLLNEPSRLEELFAAPLKLYHMPMLYCEAEVLDEACADGTCTTPSLDPALVYETGNTPAKPAPGSKRFVTRTELAFNDAWVDRSSGQTALIRVLVNEQEQLRRVRGDGVLVSTAAGSTAYAQALGASPIPADVQLIQLVGSNVVSPSRWRPVHLNQSDSVRLEVIDSDKRPCRCYVDSNCLGIAKSLFVRTSRVASVQLAFCHTYDMQQKLYHVQFPKED